MPRDPDMKSLWVSGPAKRQLDALQARMQEEKGRQVTQSEVIEWLLAARAELLERIAQTEGTHAATQGGQP